jgi:sulfur transfer complex TusBCD TusB component (DsrH family)
MIRQIRKHTHEIEYTYIESMALLFLQDDVIMAIKKREICHHLRDAGRNMNSTVDILHRIIMALA